MPIWTILAELVRTALIGLTLTLPAAAPSAGSDCALCAGALRINCMRCEGEGTRALKCDRCGGKRDVTCPIRLCGKGYLPCQACYGRSYIHWDTDAKDPCKVCARKGKVKCGFCAKKGRVPCPSCQRTGQQKVPCGACIGLGFYPCPQCRGVAPCALCKGLQELVCPRCKGSSTLPKQCPKCYDYQRVFCTLERCDIGYRICSSGCHGTGKQRTTSGAASKCDGCRGKGYERCSACEDGFIDCPEPPPRTVCGFCEGGFFACPRCKK